MKKVAKQAPKKKMAGKKADSDELRKPAKLKPLKPKEKKNWKNTLEEDEDDLDVVPDDELKLDDLGVDDEDEEFFDDKF